MKQNDYIKITEAFLNLPDEVKYLELGKHYLFVESNYADAIKCFSRILDRFADHQAALMNRAIAYMRISNYTEAMFDLDAFLEQRPYDHEALTTRGNCYFSMNSFDAAIRDYTEAIECQLEPTNDGLFHNRGIAYFALEKYEAAEKDFTQAIDLTVNNKESLVNRAETRIALGRIIGAKLDLEAVLEREPSNIKVFTMLAQVKAELKEGNLNEQRNIHN